MCRHLFSQWWRCIQWYRFCRISVEGVRPVILGETCLIDRSEGVHDQTPTFSFSLACASNIRRYAEPLQGVLPSGMPSMLKATKPPAGCPINRFLLPTSRPQSVPGNICDPQGPTLVKYPTPDGTNFRTVLMNSSSLVCLPCGRHHFLSCRRHQIGALDITR
jgi:hypothetical protein